MFDGFKGKPHEPPTTLGDRSPKQDTSVGLCWAPFTPFVCKLLALCVGLPLHPSVGQTDELMHARVHHFDIHGPLSAEGRDLLLLLFLFPPRGGSKAPNLLEDLHKHVL